MLDVEDTTESFVLKVLDELLLLKEGVQLVMPKAASEPFIWDHSKLVGVTWSSTTVDYNQQRYWEAAQNFLLFYVFCLFSYFE